MWRVLGIPAGGSAVMSVMSGVFCFSVWTRDAGLPEPGQDVVQEADPQQSSQMFHRDWAICIPVSV